MFRLAYFSLGLAFGAVLNKSQLTCWYRFQEMFRFQSPRMYEIIGSAVVVAALSLLLLKRLGLHTIQGEPVVITSKDNSKTARYLLGGSIFGIGWALTGACPGPIFALIGSGQSVFVVTLLSALVGTWLYGALRASS